MRTFRFAIVVLLLAAVPSTGFSQLLPRRRAANWDRTMEAIALDAVSKMRLNLDLKDAFKDLFRGLELSLSLQLFAELQLDPQLMKRIGSNTESGTRESMVGELMNAGSTRLLLSETAKFSERLQSEQFSAPVLEKIF